MVLGFSRGLKNFHGITLAMTFDFSRISRTNLETSVEYLQRHFLNHPACFCLEQTTDRQIDLLFWVLKYPAHCTDLELLSEPPQNKICYRLHPKYTPLSWFPIIGSSAIWKSLFLRIGATYAVFDILKEADWMLFQVSADNFCYVPILLYILWKYRYWCIYRGLCDIM